MSFKENLKIKMKIDKLVKKLISTMKEPPGKWWLDKVLTEELLHMTDFKHEKVRDLQLYVRPWTGEIMEVLVLDNALPIYRTTVHDVVLRKSPCWHEMVSIRNIRKIMNDKDVIISKGKASLQKLHADALALLDFTYTGDDMALLLEDARRGLDRKSIERIQECLGFFFEILNFQRLFFGPTDNDLQTFAMAKPDSGHFPPFKHLILFDERTLLLGMKKGAFSPERDLDLDWFGQYLRGEKAADLQGMDVFEFLAELALEKAHQDAADVQKWIEPQDPLLTAAA
ncbi:conserved hypothetical protein [delta proteobacterium NaphS2]|nr:conserved hypothetical protein [delta proteobacterium NaphS2]